MCIRDSVFGAFRTLARRAAAILAALLRDQFVGREVSQIVERLDPRLAERDEQRFGQVRQFGQIILCPLYTS